jgi:hypothetical protein
MSQYTAGPKIRNAAATPTTLLTSTAKVTAGLGPKVQAAYTKVFVTEELRE